jgi:hypothetical protein
LLSVILDALLLLLLLLFLLSLLLLLLGGPKTALRSLARSMVLPLSSSTCGPKAATRAV